MTHLRRELKNDEVKKSINRFGLCFMFRVSILGRQQSDSSLTRNVMMKLGNKVEVGE